MNRVSDHYGSVTCQFINPNLTTRISFPWSEMRNAFSLITMSRRKQQNAEWSTSVFALERFFDFSAVLHKSSNMLTSLPWYRINEPRFFLLLFWSTIIQQIIRHFVWSARPDTRFLSGFGASSPYKSISAFWYAQRSTFGLCYEIPIQLARIYRQLIVIKKSLTFWKYQEEKRLERRFWVISKPNPRDVNIRLERRI